MQGWPLTGKNWQLGYVGFAVLFWVLLALNGFPRPYADDAIMIGPAIGLQQSGFLDNPFLSRIFYPEPTYLFYPPLFSWVLLGWIALFGTSFLSLAMFWAGCGMVASVSLGRLITRLTGINLGIPVACVLLLGSLAYSGFRMEILAFATFFAGLAFAAGPGRWRRVAGYYLLFLSPTIAPTFLALSLVATLALAVWRWGTKELALAALALGLAIATLILACQGDLAGLVQTMQKYSAIRVGLGGRADYEQRLLRVLGIGIVLALTTSAIRWKGLGERITSPAVFAPLLLTLGFALSVLTHSRPSIWAAYTIGGLFLLSVAVQHYVEALAKQGRIPVPRWLVRMPLAPLGLAAFLAGFNAWYAPQYSPKPLSPRLTDLARQAVSAAPVGNLVVADAAVFGALGFPTARPIEDAMVRNPFPNFLQDFTRLPPGQTWVLTEANFLALSQHGEGRLKQGPRLERYLTAQPGSTMDNQRICVFEARASVLIAQDIEQALALYCRS